MRVAAEGLFAVDDGAHLTPSLFASLLARGETFPLKVDYRGLPPPLEELDLAWMAPVAASTLPPGSLVLRALESDFEFTRIDRRRVGGMVARVVAVERPRTRIHLDGLRWRLLGSLLVRSRAGAALFARVRQGAVRLRRAIPPGAVPLRIDDVARLTDAVAAKYGDDGEVRYQSARLASSGLEAWEIDVSRRWLPPAARVLVVGCGAGREALGFAAAGFQVTGIDFALGLVVAARRAAAARGLTVRFEHATPEILVESEAGAYDAVVCAAGVYEQTPGRRRRVDLLRALARLGAPGALIVLCAGWHRDRGPRVASIDAARALLRACGVRGVAEPGDRFTHHVSIASHHATRCFFHRFQTPEAIEAELRAAAFTWERHVDGPWLARCARA